MLTIPAGFLNIFPANTPLAAVTLPKYRELLRQLKANGSVEESSNAFQQAKERVLLRLQQRRERARLDPNRAFRRLRKRMLEAQHSLRQLKNEQKEKLRQYYYEAVRGTAAVASSSGGGRVGLLGVDGRQVTSSGDENALVRRDDSEMPLDPSLVQRTLGPNGIFRSLVIAAVGASCKVFLHGASHTTITGQDVMRRALERPAGQALITVSNHVGSIDDPLITSAVVPIEYLLKPEALRWTMCASDRCFKSKLLAPFFRAAKVLPVERGAGLSQYGMRVAQSRLAAGDWVHIFPEGTRSRTGKMGPVRKGVGWLVASCETPPLVVPFVHSGMEKVIPKGAKLPQTGQEVKVAVGDPVDVADLLAAAREEGWSDNQLHVAITDRIGQALYVLKAQLDGLPLEEVVPQRAEAVLTISEETLLPLIEEEIDSMSHRWRDSWQRSGLPSLTHRIRERLRERAAAYGMTSLDHGDGCQEDMGGEDLGAGVLIGDELAAASPPLACSEPSEEGKKGWRRQGLILRTLREQQGVLRMLRGSRMLTRAASAHDMDGELSVGAAAEASSAQLRMLMSAAVDYSAERVRRMRQLLGEPTPALP